MNIIVGENDVGKSTLIKSLYHTLGADTPQLHNTRWKNAHSVYLLKFSVNSQKYSIFRDERYFGVFDSKQKLLGRYKGISTDGGISDFINPLLKFNVELETKDEILRRLGPPYYFLPFYVDQDEGWNKTWVSFNGLQAIKDYRNKMLDYHLGIRPQGYYDAQKKAFELKEQLKELEGEMYSLTTVRDSFKKKKSLQKIDIDPEVFKDEMESLVGEYNRISEVLQGHLNLIKKARNEKLNIESEIAILKRSIREQDADYSFCESPDTPDLIDCPTCGTGFENSVSERFGILDDIDYCAALIDQRKKEVLLIDEKLKGLDEEYASIVKGRSSIEEILQRTREQVTFSEIVVSEGYKEMVSSISEDITDKSEQYGSIDSQLSALQKTIVLDSDLKKKITAFYQIKMKGALNKLNVQVLTEDDYKTPSKLIKSNALGSDLPRSLLAQYISLLQTMEKFNSFIVCPLVIDSPLQQEQDNTNTSAIFNFIFSNTLEDQQLILGTLGLDGVIEDQDIPSACNKITLNKKYGLLSDIEYLDVLEEVAPLQELTLKSDQE